VFKWACLGVATIFLIVVGWMVNDVRLEIRRSTDVVRTTGQTVNEHLPTLVDRSRKATDTLAENLPEIVAKTKTTTETLAELAEDIRQLKELAGVSHTARDRNLVSYADSVLDTIEASGGKIGVKRGFGSSELKNPIPAKEWVVAARKEALLLTVLAKSQKELADRLMKNKFGSPWYLQVPGREPTPLLEWLKANHAASRDL
jgi:hypothetical protein